MIVINLCYLIQHIRFGGGNVTWGGYKLVNVDNFSLFRDVENIASLLFYAFALFPYFNNFVSV